MPYRLGNLNISEVRLDLFLQSNFKNTWGLWEMSFNNSATLIWHIGDMQPKEYSALLIHEFRISAFNQHVDGKYSWPLNKMGLNCKDPLTHRFTSINIMPVFSFYRSLCKGQFMLRDHKMCNIKLRFEFWFYPNCFSFLPLGESLSIPLFLRQR